MKVYNPRIKCNLAEGLSTWSYEHSHRWNPTFTTCNSYIQSLIIFFLRRTFTYAHRMYVTFATQHTTSKRRTATK